LLRQFASPLESCSVESLSDVILSEAKNDEVTLRITSIRFPAEQKTVYFFVSHVHSLAGLLHPEQTLSLIGLPHFLHGVHPHV